MSPAGCCSCHKSQLWASFSDCMYGHISTALPKPRASSPHIHSCSSFLPGLPASRLSSLQPSLHAIARAQLMQLNRDHTLRNPQQKPSTAPHCPQINTQLPHLTPEDRPQLVQILPCFRIPAPSNYLLRSEHVVCFSAHEPLFPLISLSGISSCPFSPLPTPPHPRFLGY